MQNGGILSLIVSLRMPLYGVGSSQVKKNQIKHKITKLTKISSESGEALEKVGKKQRA